MCKDSGACLASCRVIRHGGGDSRLRDDCNVMNSKSLVITLALASFTGLLSQFALSTLLPVVAEDVGSTVPLLGQTITMSFLVGALLVLGIGPMADHYGHRRLMLLGTILVAGSAVGTAFAVEYWTVLLTRLPGGIGGGIMASISVVLASTRFPPEERRWAIGWAITGISIAPIIGTPSLAFIGELLGWRASFVALGLLALVAGVLLRLVVSPDAASPEKRFRIRDTIGAYRPLITHRPARFLQISNFLRAVGWGAAVTYFSAYLINVHDYSLRQVGYLTMVVGVGYLFGTRLGDGRRSRLSLRSLFSLSTLVMGLTFALVLNFKLDMWLLIIPIIAGVAAGGIGFVALTILMSEESPAGPATTMMLRQSGFSLGLAGGGAAGGLALAIGGYDLLGLGVLVFAIASSAMVYWPAPRRSPIPPEPAPGSATSS